MLSRYPFPARASSNPAPAAARPAASGRSFGPGPVTHRPARAAGAHGSPRELGPPGLQVSTRPLAGNAGG